MSSPICGVEPHVTAVADPYVVAQWTMTGTQSGAFNGCRPPTRASSCPESMSSPWARPDCSPSRAISTSDPPRPARCAGHRPAGQRRASGLWYLDAFPYRQHHGPRCHQRDLDRRRLQAEAEGVKERAGESSLSWHSCPASSAGSGSASPNGFTPSPCGTIPTRSGDSGQAPSTKPLRERCSSRISALPSIPESGFPNTSIRSGCGARRVEP